MNIGIEIEFTGMIIREKHLKSCSFCYDGSIKAQGLAYGKNMTGCVQQEIKTRVLNTCESNLEFDNHVYSFMKQLNTVAHAYRPVVNETCGLHIHFSELDWYDNNNTDWKKFPIRLSTLFTIIKNAVKWEDKVFKYFQRYDFRKRYADKLNDNEIVTPDCATKTEVVNFLRNLDSDARYRWLNLQSLLKHGTVEFRLFNGTFDIHEIAKAIYFVECMTQEDMDFNQFMIDVNNPVTNKYLGWAMEITTVPYKNKNIHYKAIDKTGYITETTYVDGDETRVIMEHNGIRTETVNGSVVSERVLYDKELVDLFIKTKLNKKEMRTKIERCSMNAEYISCMCCSNVCKANVYFDWIDAQLSSNTSKVIVKLHDVLMSELNDRISPMRTTILNCDSSNGEEEIAHVMAFKQMLEAIATYHKSSMAREEYGTLCATLDNFSQYLNGELNAMDEYTFLCNCIKLIEIINRHADVTKNTEMLFYPTNSLVFLNAFTSCYTPVVIRDVIQTYYGNCQFVNDSVIHPAFMARIYYHVIKDTVLRNKIATIIAENLSYENNTAAYMSTVIRVLADHVSEQPVGVTFANEYPDIDDNIRYPAVVYASCFDSDIPVDDSYEVGDIMSHLSVEDEEFSVWIND